MPLRFSVKAPKLVMLVGVCILGLMLVCGFGVSVTADRKSPTAGDSTGGPTSDWSSGAIRGGTSGRRPIEDVTTREISALLGKTPSDMTALLGRPDIKYRGESYVDSWRYLGGWQRKNGNYVMIAWIERIHPLTGRLELANVTINPGWENISRERLEAHKGLVR
jgi:hypothetical protein